MAAMRKLAWRLGWLDRSVDPLDGLELGRTAVLHGATAQFVDPRLRTETRSGPRWRTRRTSYAGPREPMI
jgi:hypothetical protein